jgi:hypothetical protein
MNLLIVIKDECFENIELLFDFLQWFTFAFSYVFRNYSQTQINI